MHDRVLAARSVLTAGLKKKKHQKSKKVTVRRELIYVCGGETSPSSFLRTVLIVQEIETIISLSSTAKQGTVVQTEIDNRVVKKF